MSSVAADTPKTGVFSRQYALATLGMSALIGLAAFEALAVTTVMPTVSRLLHGESLYSLSFAAPLATSLVGTVAAGNWADRRGPRPVVITAISLFAAGLLVVGTAPTMTVLLLGRLLQGFGSGALIVGLYVMVSDLFPQRLHASVFAGFAAAWVIPGLIGPVIAGSLTQTVGWHGVFIGALFIAVPSFAVLLPSLVALPKRVLADGDDLVPWSLRRLLWAALAAAAVVSLNLVSEVPPVVAGLIGVAAIVALAVALRPLIPRGTLRAARGIPTLVLLRGLAGAAFLGGDVYIPYLLGAQFGFSPAASGITLTTGAVSWALASWIVGRLGDRVQQLTGIRLGFGLVVIGVASAIATAAFHLSPILIVVGWTVTGFGMGFTFSRFSVLVLRWSDSDERGFNSSSLTIADAAGAAVVLALTGAAFGLLGGAKDPAAFVACFTIAGAVAVLGLAVSGRAIAHDA